MCTSFKGLHISYQEIKEKILWNAGARNLAKSKLSNLEVELDQVTVRGIALLGQVTHALDKAYHLPLHQPGQRLHQLQAAAELREDLNSEGKGENSRLMKNKTYKSGVRFLVLLPF